MIHPRQRTHQGHRGLAPAVLLSVLLVLLAGAPPAAAWLHDSDGNRIDDRIQAVESLGLAAGFEGGDVEDGRARIAIFGGDTEPLRYGVYVGYDHHPTAEDLDALADSGVSTAVLHPYRFIDYVRMELTFAEIETVAALPGVTRVEAIPMMYPVNNVATRTSGVSADDFQRFPTVHEHLGITGCGVVVSILDTGVNDAPDPVTGFPGHESVEGKFVAGGDFFLGDPNFNTGTDDSSNPVDRGEAASSTHGTHVAGTAIGTGGSSGVFGGVAPCADLVDQKVLSDAGAGFGSADGVEWAILNKDRYGIRVLNLSLGSLDESDGTDASSQTINAAFDAGLVPVIAMGNDGETGFVSSPAAADKALSIGALADQNSVRRDDDRIAGFSNEGPRDSDGDADFTDEMKPLVAGPGAGIVSSDGSLLSDGRQYKSLSGTSMSTPHVAGVVALVLAANPALGPAEVVEILRHTSEHRNDWGKTPPGADPFPEGDPNYHPSGGWGQVDAYAAVKEALRLAGDPASRTQVVFADARPAEDASAAVDLTWRTQREIDLVGFDLFRAPDAGGAPGAFVQINDTVIPGVGSADIEGLPNRNEYTFRDDEGLVPGETYWYRIEHTSADPAVGTVREPALPVTVGEARPVARLEYSITHNAPDNDLLVLLGSGSQPERARFIVDGKPSNEADSVTTEPGEATTGNLRHDFSIVLTDRDGVGELLPPSEDRPWFLSVKEGGFINRKGRVNAFAITLFDEDGNPTQTFETADPTPQETAEGVTTVLWIPDDPEVTAPGETPGVIEAEPDAVAQGEQGVAVDVFGSEFLPGAAAEVSGTGVSVDEVEWVSGSQLSTTLSVAPDAPAGPRDVTVTNLDGGSGTGSGVLTVTGDGGSCEPVVTDVDDADAAVGTDRGWHRKSSEDASAGGFHERVGSPGGGSAPSVTLVFEGEQVTYSYATSAAGGEAEVFLDGASAGTVSFAGTAHRRSPEFGHSATFAGLGEGTHELVIEHRGGVSYVDGFRVVSCPGGGGDASAVTTRSETTASREDLVAGTLVRTLEVGPEAESISVVVDGSDRPLAVSLLDPAGALLASGEALLDGLNVSGVDAPANGSGSYSLQVTDALGGSASVELSVAVTVRVR